MSVVNLPYIQIVPGEALAEVFLHLILNCISGIRIKF